MTEACVDPSIRDPKGRNRDSKGTEKGRGLDSFWTHQGLIWDSLFQPSFDVKQVEISINELPVPSQYLFSPESAPPNR
jgi:hypothetical protein